jgi:hypothetical protein
MYAEKSGERWEQSRGLGLKSWTDGMAGHMADAQAAATRSLAIAAELEDPWLCATAEVGLALNSLIGGDPTDALLRLTPLCSGAPGRLDRMLHGYASMQRALTLFLLGDRTGARAELALTVDLTAAMGSARTAAGCCELMAYLAATDADFEQSAWLLGAAMTGREIVGGPLAPQWVEAHSAVSSLVQRELGAESFEQAIALGRRSVLSESFTLVRNMLSGKQR